MRFVLWLLSPAAMLCAIFVSYFYLALTLPFLSQMVGNDLLWLGIYCAALSYIVLNFKYQFIEVSERILSCNLLAINFLFLIVEVYLRAIFKYDFMPQLDNRFSIPGFGLISSLFLLGSLFGFCILPKVRSSLQKLIFLVLLFLIGFQIGGKGFIIPLLFGYGLSIRLGFRKVDSGILAILAILGASFIFVLFLVLGGDVNEALDHLILRLTLSADSVNWLSKMSYLDVLRFPIDTLSYISDIILRLVGLRINQRAVGSEVAYIVAGDDTGGGPNSNLPVLIYLINHGQLIGSFILITAILLIVKFILNIMKKEIQLKSNKSLYYSITAFILPNIIIDLIVFMQFLFWVLVIFLFTTLILQLQKSLNLSKIE